MSAIFKREFKAYFQTPLGFIVLAVYYFFLGNFFSLFFSYGSPDLPGLLLGLLLVVTFTTPIITMRLMSDDRRNKVDQVLLTAPVKLSSIVLGKFFAALLVYTIGFAPSIIFEIIVASYVSVNVFSYIYALFGMILLGSALISIGMLISSLTESPVIAAILALVANIVALYMSSISSVIPSIKNSWLSIIAEKAAFISAVESFGNDIFSIPDVIYFLSITAAFLFLTVRSLEKRRWA